MPEVRSHKTLAPGEALFRQGDPTRALFTVERGRVRLVRHLADGAAVTLHVAGPGETFAEASLFSDVYHCDAIADTESTVTPRPKGALLAAFARDPDAATAFMAKLARQVMGLRTRLEIRNIRPARERVLQFLRLEGDATGTGTFARPLKDIAGDIGLTHEAFYRALAALERDGLIRRAGRTIAVLDLPATRTHS